MLSKYTCHSKVSLLCLSFSLFLVCFLACQKSPSSAQKTESKQSVSTEKHSDKPTQKSPDQKAAVTDNANEVAVIETNHGKIVLQFDAKVAPNHVANFKNLARTGFYNGTTFHRVIPGFMIQGGDPLSKDDQRGNDGTGGSGKNVPAEFSSKPHNRGTVSMARSQNPDSASSQFFICVAPAPHLNGQYSAFGEVIEGMEVVDKIVNLKADARSNPLEPAIMKTVTLAASN